MDDYLQQLIKGASAQVTYANRAWLSLAALAFFVVLPSAPSPSGTRALPFALGNIPAAWFSFVATLLLAVLCIAFCSAHTQAVRAHMLAQRMLDKSKTRDAQRSEGISPRDLFDATVKPALNRVAPLSLVLRGRHQFYADQSPGQPSRRIVAGVLYLYLKVLAGLVYYFLPALALVIGLRGYVHTGHPIWAIGSHIVVGMFVAGAAVALGIVMFMEVSYIRKAFQAISGGESEAKALDA